MKIKHLFLMSLSMLTGIVLLAQNSSISKGVGFSQAFESGTSVYDIRFNYYSKQDFLNIKKLGIDEVRLPIFFANMVQENGKLSPLFLYLLDQYVDIAEEVDINIILTNMSGYDYSDTASIRSQFINIWTQMAEHYKNRSTLIHYELANEPSGISDEDWGRIQGDVIDAIRQIDHTHTIIVTPANWGSLFNLKYLPYYEDNNLIYVFHFYDPFLFTHQGSGLAGLGELKGVPFPYDADKMPPMPPSFIGSWNEWRYYDYTKDGTAEAIEALIDTAATFMNERNVRLWCGEFGADDQYSDPDDRAFWYATLRTSLEQNGIAWSMHGYTRYWGLFEFGSDKLFDYDLNMPIVEAMGLNTQPQSEFEVKPDSTAFVIYDDYVSRNLDLWISVDDTLSHVYAQNDPKNGRFCIQMKDFPIWSMFRFNFIPERDFSILVEEGYCLSFWIKGDAPGARFNVRFFDTDTDDPNDHPWRMVYDIDENLASWDNEWHWVQIPLASFKEQGAADAGIWYEPEGKFDWSAIDEFHIQTEFEGLEGKQFRFDDIQIIPKAIPDSVNVTFKVDMQNETVSSSGVYLNGSFCSWDPSNAVQLTANGSVYSTNLTLSIGETVEYKFVNGAADDWAQYEILAGTSCAFGNDANRGFVVPNENTTLELVCFESCKACSTTSIEEQQGAEICLFPNPTKNSIKLTNLPVNENIIIKIYNTNSQLLREISTNNQTSIQIELSDVNAGIYIINLIGDDLNKTLKIIKED